MLTSKQKIKSQDFKDFYKKGKKKSSENFRTSLFFSNDEGFPKYSVVLSKKTIKTAVLRNKNKRKIYKILSQIYPQFPLVRYGFIFVKRDIINVDENELKTDLIQHLNNKQNTF